MPQLPSRGMALTGSIFAIITGSIALILLVLAVASVHGLNGGAVIVAGLVGLTEVTGVVLGGVGCTVRAGPILANAIVFTVLTLVSIIGIAAAGEHIHPLAIVGILLHALTTIFLWVGFPQAARYRRALAAGSDDAPARPSAARPAPKPSGPLAESAAAESEDARVLRVMLQQGMSLLRGDVVLVPGALYFICAKKGGMMGMVVEGLGTHFGAIGGLISGAIGGALQGVAESAAAKNREQMIGRLDELVEANKGSFKADPSKLEIIGRSFWGTGAIRVGAKKWFFRNGMPKEHAKPFKQWCVENGARHRNLK